MEKKQTNKKKQYQSAVMYLMIAFSFCLFLSLKAYDSMEELELKHSVIPLDETWEIQSKDQIVNTVLPGPFVPEKGKTIRYSINLQQTIGNTIMLKSVHQYIRIYVDDVLIKESGYHKNTSFSEVPYESWILARLPRDWIGKKLTIEEYAYYEKYSKPLDRVYLGNHTDLIFMIVRQSLPVIILSISIIMIALSMLLFSYIFIKKTIMHQVRWLSIFSIVMCTWMILQSQWCQILWGFVPLYSNFVYIAYSLVPIAILRYLLTYQIFSKDKSIEILYWLSVCNFIVVHFLQIAGILDYIYSISLTNVIVILLMVRILYIFLIRIIQKKKLECVQIFLAGIAISIFSVLDIVGFYTKHSEKNAAYYSKFGLLLFFIILSYHEIREVLARQERGVRQHILEEMAYTDMLTGLPNRNAFEQEIFRRREKERGHCTVVVADLNGLKKINDTMGHQKGDELLIQSGKLLKKAFPERALLYRIGGDEFCLFIDDMKPEEMKKVVRFLNQNHLSIAIGCCEETSGGIDKAFLQADVNMYKKKKEMKEEHHEWLK